jgi:hypothetical protein
LNIIKYPEPLADPPPLPDIHNEPVTFGSVVGRDSIVIPPINLAEPEVLIDWVTAKLYPKPGLSSLNPILTSFLKLVSSYTVKSSLTTTSRDTSNPPVI